ncbi:MULTISPECIES: cytochrome P450 [Mycobacterium]|uniref:cytochrome P450 n=1 Tax=Mycobacterium TaxID=1763 RepID=UPI001CD92B72|nr:MULTISPECIES: cytochrome P450 [Mycobacterium]MCA2245781.1 cytochrome P450 [Mycobacterium sp. WUMAC-067]MCA2317535.1 cytochrome P450 [Mycobacterium sp. WUMAC-025]MEE3752616.1 cytochrome P450 [Mycobacterium intracellulare]
MTSADVASIRLPWDAADPYPFYEARRADGEVVWDDTAQAWLALSYEAAREVLGGSGWTSDPVANPLARAAIDPLSADFFAGSMLFADGTRHTRLRTAVRDVFTRSFVANLGAGVEAITAALIGEPEVAVPFDFMAEIALPLPIAVICSWLNLQPATARLLRELSPVIIRMLGALADADEIAAGAAAGAALVAEFLPMAADRRTHSGDDLLSFIAADPDISLEEVAATAILIAVAGHETTANMLGAGIVTLLTAADDGSRVLDRIDPADPALVTELLRLHGPVQSTVRTATTDHTIAGTQIAAGDTVLVVVAAANRDPAVFDQPDQFRLDRHGSAPLSFGYGAHYCLGAAVAQLELRTAIPKTLERQPVLAGSVHWRDTAAIRGPLSVPLIFTSR